MNFRTKFNLPDIITDILIKFMRLEISNNKCETFCNFLYTVKKLFELNNIFVNLWHIKNVTNYI